MKKILVLTLVAVLASSCSALQTEQNPASSIDTQATINAVVQTSAARTLAAQPSPTTAPPTNTGTPVVASSPTAEATSDAPSPTPAPNLTTTPATATSGPTDSNIATATQAASLPGAPTLTPTLGILKYGTLPPAVPSAKIKVINKSGAQAYISLQNYPLDKEVAILEYPVEKQVRFDAPLGYYVYVVWVGGRKIVGDFTLHNADDLTITIYKTKVETSN